MDYGQAWKFIDDLQLHKIKLGLDSMERFLGRLGNPWRRYPCVHVGGTNGKGSVAATLLALLSRAGYRAGLYTSPHLGSVRERFRIGGRFISEAEFSDCVARLQAVLNGDLITYFEATTSVAMTWFADAGVDIAIFEVGMGGRLDATNVVSPLAAVITNVSMDHEQYLGDTLAKVAFEKAGIIKPGVPLVTAMADDPGREVVLRTARERGAPCFLLGRDFSGELTGRGRWRYQGLDLAGAGSPVLDDLPLRLAGAFQAGNAAMALAVCQLLGEHGLGVDEAAVRAGLEDVRWPGRLEEFWIDGEGGASRLRPDEEALDRGFVRHYLLDGAHNPAGVEALCAALESEFAYDRLIVVWGAMADKDLGATLGRVAPLADSLILTRPAGDRAAGPEKLFNVLPTELRDRARLAPSVVAALDQATEQARPEDLILVAGSLYLVGAARSMLLGELVD